MKRFAVLTFLLAVYLVIQAPVARTQDFAFANGFESPLYLNPGFAGSSESPVLTTHFKKISNIGNYFSSAVSYDQPVEKLRGGIGLVLSTMVHEKYLFENLINGIYSYHIKINDDFFINPAVNIGFGYRYFDDSDFFSHNPIFGPVSKSYFNAGVGLLTGYRNIVAGISVDHLNRPDVGFENYKVSLPAKITLHGIWQHEIQEDVYLFPGLIYQTQSDYHRLTPSVMIDYRGLRVGAAAIQIYETSAWGDIATGVAAIAGIKFQKLVVGYSFASRLLGDRIFEFPTHEFALTYRFKE